MSSHVRRYFAFVGSSVTSEAKLRARLIGISCSCGGGLQSVSKASVTGLLVPLTSASGSVITSVKGLRRRSPFVVVGQ
jgi:hypothetical protein